MAGAPTTYDELKTALMDAGGTDGGSAYAADPDIFIDMAEERFSASLKTREQVTKTTLTMDANGESDLPADYAAYYRAVGIEGSRRVELDECSPEWMDDEYPYTTSGIAQHVTVDGSKIRVRPVTSTVELRYYAQVPALSESQTTNWLLTKHPAVYLYGSLFELSRYYAEWEDAAQYERLLADRLALLMERDSNERIASKRLQVKGPTP